MTGRVREGRSRRTWGQRALIAVNLFLIAISLSSAYLLWSVYGRAASVDRVALGRSLTEVPDAEPGERVLNILLVGSDSSAGLDEDDPIQVGRQGERLGDVIIIAHVDERTNEIALLSIPRDLWVEIGDTGRSGRINRAFFTGGPSLLIDTIEREFDLPIHHYANVDFAGFQGLVAAVESVDVWFDTPARDWNITAKPVPRSQTGFIVETSGCHTLDPEMALAYVRSRYYQTQGEDGVWRTDPTADLGRIRRQQDFLRRAIRRAIELGARNPFVLRDLVDTALDHVAIDQELTAQFLVDLGGTFASFDPETLQTYSFPNGAALVGTDQVQMPMMTDAEPVLELFRGAEFSDPSTVLLRVRVAPDAQISQRIEVVNGLRQAGFVLDPEEDEAQNEVEGLVLRHGPDGAHAAALVASQLDTPPRIEQVAWLAGRSLELVVGVEPVPAEEPDSDSATDGATGVTTPSEMASEASSTTVPDSLVETTQAGRPADPVDDGTMTPAEECG